MTSWLFGSAPDCDVVIDQQAVSGNHCRLTQQSDGFYLEDLQSTNGTYVNGQRLSASQQVSSADKITLGQKIPLPWPTVASTGADRIVSVGQAQDNDVVIDHPAMSGHHARLVIRGKELLIEDLGSTNGTFVGSTSRRIQESVVQPDDKVFFGSHGITVRELLAGSSTSAAAANNRQPAAATTPPAEKIDWNEYLLPALAGAALLVICVVGLLMVLSSGGNEETEKLSSEVAEQSKAQKSGTSAQAATTGGAGFRMEKYDPDHVVEQIRITIRVSSQEQDLKESVDLDLGAGFLLRLSPVTTEVPTEAVVAFPQKSSLKKTETIIAAGAEAWFEFSADEEENSEGEFSATPQVLADFSFDQIRAIRFEAQGKTAWVLEGYEIEINGELFASHGSVNWHVKGQRREDQIELAALLSREKTLAKDLADIELYIQQGLGEASDERDLQKKKKEMADLAVAIKTLRQSVSNSRVSYIERNPAFAPGAAAAAQSDE
jgi:pSer/pThr/pTyr-binding forkhead associated (FHA) protein